MAVDGYLNFDTKINTKGFTKGVKDLNKKFISSATDVKAAFDMVYSSISRVTASFSRLTDAYRTQIESEARLGATMKNSTSASSAQIESVKELASSLQELGVVGDEVQLAGAQELATYVGQTESIKKMLPVLNDMIAQQYGYSASTDSAVTIATMLGKVLQGQTSALSRYGYKFDENQEKLLKFGTEEQRVATLAAVVEESVSGVNAALADTPTGKVKQLENEFGDLKETMGKLLTETVYPLVIKLDVVVKKLNEVFTAASSGIKAAFGIKGDVSVGGMTQSTAELDDSASDAADSYADMADSAKKAEKANKGSLAAFDELNVLAREDVSDDDTGVLPQAAESAETGEAFGIDTSEFEAQIDTVIDKITKGIDFIKNQLTKAKDFAMPLFDAVSDHIGTVAENVKNGVSGYLNNYSADVKKYSDRIKTHLTNTAAQTRNGVTNIINEASASQKRMSGELSQGYTDILGGASIFSLSFIDVFTGMYDIVSGKFEEFTLTNSGLLGEFFDGINGNFANLLSTVGGILEDIGSHLTAWWDGTGSEAFGNFTAAIFDIIAVVLDLWKSYISPFIDYLIDSLGDLWADHILPLWDGILGFISSLWDAVAAIWDNLLRPLYDTFIKRMLVGVMGALKSVWDIITGLFGAVVDILRGVVRVAKGLLDFITGIFTGDLDKAFDGIEEMFEGVIIAIWGAFKGVLNTMIGAMNTVWSAIYGVIKSIVDGVGDFVSFLGDAVGADWGFSLPDEVPRIPKLAQGTVIPANYGEFAAILGDNKREAEVVSPISAMKQAFLEALAESGIAGGSGDDRDIVIELDGDVLFRVMRKKSKSYSRMHGGRPAFG